jgi:hypothetical protein
MTEIYQPLAFWRSLPIRLNQQAAGSVGKRTTSSLLIV